MKSKSKIFSHSEGIQMKTKKQIQFEKNSIKGKKAKASGARFERKVRKDLESKGRIVDRWSNNVEIFGGMEKSKIIPWGCKFKFEGKLIPAKSRFGMRTTGFPDFVIFKIRDGYSYYDEEGKTIDGGLHFTKDRIVVGVEVKSNGYLKKIEKEKCFWLIENKIFNKILIASKSKEKRGKIIYNEFPNEK